MRSGARRSGSCSCAFVKGRQRIAIPIAWSLLLLLGSQRLFAASALSRGDDVDAFQFTKTRWPNDAAFVYRETQIGSHRLDSLTTLYLDAKGNLQALKLLRTAPRPMLVTARFDWAIASVVHYGSYYLPMRSDKQPVAMADFDLAHRILTISAKGLRSRVLHVGSLPFHVHDFELMSLGVAMRFLKQPEKPFTFELIGMDRKHKLFFKDSGRILVKYAGPRRCRRDESKQCREYDMLWADSTKYFGRIQLEAASGDLVLVETVVPDEPGITSLRLQLVGRRVMTQVKWKEMLERAPQMLHGTYPDMRSSVHHK